VPNDRLWYAHQSLARIGCLLAVLLANMTLKNVVVSSLLAGLALATPLEKRQSAVPFGVAILSCTVPGKVAITFDDGPYIYDE
jgi:hypothetical protein